MTSEHAQMAPFRTIRIYRPRIIGKNNNHEISWDLEVVSTWNFSQKKTKEFHFMTKEFHWSGHFFISADIRKNVFWSVKYAWVTWPKQWRYQWSSFIKEYPWYKFQLHTMSGTRNSRKVGVHPPSCFGYTERWAAWRVKVCGILLC